ncbi:hypothetical protein [Epilithonimonas sp.]|uniref:hypothetical protein n=1 Tax=Epilithonimonas sp. TaxID=2894511 RepID=UPI00289C11C8|nr:hypothetical protein [Epilithonimonas sp.]
MILEIKNYIRISNSIDEILKNSPFKLKYIIEKSGISEPTFFRKMKEKKFNPEELLKIAEIIDPETSFLQTLEEAEKDFDNETYFSHDDVIKISEERFLKKYGNKMV